MSVFLFGLNPFCRIRFLHLVVFRQVGTSHLWGKLGWNPDTAASWSAKKTNPNNDTTSMKTTFSSQMKALWLIKASNFLRILKTPSMGLFFWTAFDD
jgi:hypothetical protein